MRVRPPPRRVRLSAPRVASLSSAFAVVSASASLCCGLIACLCCGRRLWPAGRLQWWARSRRFRVVWGGPLRRCGSSNRLRGRAGSGACCFRRAPGGGLGAGLVLVAQDKPLQERHRDDDREENEGDGAALSPLVVDERGLVGEERGGQCRLARTALAHDVDLVEDLPGADESEGQDEEEGRLEHGQRDVAEPLPAPGAVDLGCFLDFEGDVLQRGE